MLPPRSEDYIAVFDGAIGRGPFRNERDDRMRCLVVKLGAMGARKPGDMARELDHGDLHS